MEFSKKIVLGVRKLIHMVIIFIIKNMTYMPNKHHIGFILNKIHNMYITSRLNIIVEMFELFPKLIFYQMF